MVNKEIVEYIAKLARIEITEQEKDFLSSQLSKILDYIDTLKEVDVKDVEVFRGYHVKDYFLREDNVVVFKSKEKILKNAPLEENNYFKIPKVIG
ncbi:MAG: Asp-tRNA(Asn)/Glu-tRNA(Gln) amidotransferase subunit GatC [Candidatus Omnitrophica bacterium]|nr:Asp-tRNA(Asn)/Glu-tRNA(Gln) amidotransferase subunit GatC [Candidatus Omnitrophota bacterium]MCM8831816.1 Asp-tRNA(Asn)/Glu-tRNA(Gln) amidotransferase subunit GatC [Candidatus Omnitrophota bacterium]